MNKEMEALERLYKSHEENCFAPFPTRSDLDIIRLALTELAEIKGRAEEQQDKYKYAYTEGINNDSVAKIIDYILKGETK